MELLLSFTLICIRFQVLSNLNPGAISGLNWTFCRMRLCLPDTPPIHGLLALSSSDHSLLRQLCWPLRTHCSLPLASHPPHVSCYCQQTSDPQLHPALTYLQSPAFPTPSLHSLKMLGQLVTPTPQHVLSESLFY